MFGICALRIKDKRFSWGPQKADPSGNLIRNEEEKRMVKGRDCGLPRQRDWLNLHWRMALGWVFNRWAGSKAQRGAEYVFLSFATCIFSRKAIRNVTA